MATRAKPKPTARPRPRARPLVKRPNANPARPMLDTAAAAYARLLADPCDAGLARPLYMGTGTGYLTRFTQDYSFTNDSGVFVVTPSNYGGGTSATIQSANDNASATLLTLVNQVGPGYTFLNTNAADARPVAACLTTIYTGTELNRAGLINRCQLTGDAATGWGAGVLSYDTISSSFPTEDRTPTGRLEVKWAPGQRDADFSNAATNSRQPNNAALAVLWRGLGTSSSLKFRVTIVYEWRPPSNESIVLPPSAGNPSRNTVEQAVGALYDTNPNWAFSAARGMARQALPRIADYILPGAGRAASYLLQ